MNPRILHIAAHLGGGVGRFVTNVYGSDDGFSHTFLLLEAPRNKDFLSAAGIQILLIDDIESAFTDYCRQFDIIQIEFWNHPLLYRFLFQQKTISKTRLLFYCHVNGLFAPNIIIEPLVKASDLFIVSTFSSTHSRVIASYKHKVHVVPEFGGSSRTAAVSKLEHKGFNIIYIGSADRIKLHNDYIALCQQIVTRVPRARFIFCSQDDSAYLQQQAKDARISDHIAFYRDVQDIGKLLAIADVFGYPLNPRHFGTGEQVLIEAMGAGVPSVLLGNLPEQYIVKDGVTGVIADSTIAYVKAMEFLAQQPDIVDRMGHAAKEYALTEMSAKKTLGLFHEVYKQALSYHKSDHTFDFDELKLNSNDLGLELFLISQGADNETYLYALANGANVEYWRWKIGLKRQELSPHKGTLSQYQEYFPESSGLNRLIEIVKASTYE